MEPAHLWAEPTLILFGKRKMDRNTLEALFQYLTPETMAAVVVDVNNCVKSEEDGADYEAVWTAAMETFKHYSDDFERHTFHYTVNKLLAEKDNG